MTRRQGGILCLAVLCCAGMVAAQEAKPLTPGDVYCSGIVTREAVPADLYVISGEESSYQTTYAQGDYIYLNRGSSGGVKVGDEFLLMRPEKNPARVKWFRYQPRLMMAMGTQWVDVGRVKVVSVQPNVAIARVVSSCEYVQRGDIARPFAERPSPPTKPYDGNLFPNYTGKSEAMVVSAKYFAQQVAARDIAYINAGSNQGVKVGDYVRFYRYQGTRHETAYQLRGTAHKMWGFGKTPVPYTWKDLPRELLGEGVVLRVSENAATVFIMHSLRSIFQGDYVEIE
jgi:hypothetical protein